MIPDWREVRAAFEPLRAPEPRCYLDTASMGLPPAVVVEEVRQSLEDWEQGRASWRAWEARAEEARRLLARVVGVGAERVSLTNSFSAAASQVAASLPDPARSKRDVLVVGAEEFRSNLFPWWLQERRGFHLRQIPFRGGGPGCEDLIAAIDGRTALVAVSHVQSATGYRVDVERLADACRDRGTLLFVDGTQSVGAVPTPIEGIDFLATHAYKWLLAPRGAAFLVVDPARLDTQVPLQPSWRSPAPPHTAYYGGPFEPGGGASALDASLAWLSWVGAARALEFLLEVGLEGIHARAAELAARFRGGLDALGLDGIAGRENASPIVALDPGVD
ncbi:MAG TPA: aminotransferase class V-fold PLP-dependent enzyme, partial [Planctomycetes bacterium]|nr:aminotransferase class V-fold PLP-dependent enzyme [Planctomycetota bacterium]